MTTTTKVNQLAQDFISHAVSTNVLRFGEFTTKAGRQSPYFFNAGLYNDGQSLSVLAQFYARRLITSNLQFDMIFGPAYKGITLAAAVAIELSRLGQNIPYAYNRKEAKDHGEGGALVGSPVKGRVLIIDDVISAGTSVRESIQIIEKAGGVACGVAIALDRQEKATQINTDGSICTVDYSASQFVTENYKLPVIAIANLQELLSYLNSSQSGELSKHYQHVLAYREKYGVL